MGFRRLQNGVAVVLIIVAVVGLFFQKNIEEWWRRHSLATDRRPLMGQLSEIHGHVKIRLPGSLQPIEAFGGMNIHSGDSIVTEDGRASVQFTSKLKVEVQPDSIVVVNHTDSELIFVKGRVKLLSEAPGISLPTESLTKGEAENSTAINGPEVQKDIQKSELFEEPKVNVHKKVDENKTLPDSYISSVIRSQKPFLNRCYAQHLKNDPDAQGRIDTSLTIEPDGTVSTARVIGSTIADPQLQQCVVTTLLRTRFRIFASDPIIVSYPITFD